MKNLHRSLLLHSSDCLEERHSASSLSVPHSPTFLTGRLHLGHVVSQEYNKRDLRAFVPTAFPNLLVFDTTGWYLKYAQ